MAKSFNSGQFTFIHAYIAEFGNSEGFKYYQFNAIPTNFLNNPEGRIIVMDLRRKELINVLSRLIKWLSVKRTK